MTICIFLCIMIIIINKGGIKITQWKIPVNFAQIRYAKLLCRNNIGKERDPCVFLMRIYMSVTCHGLNMFLFAYYACMLI
jgi:hypothetical protein